MPESCCLLERTKLTALRDSSAAQAVTLYWTTCCSLTRCALIIYKPEENYSHLQYLLVWCLQQEAFFCVLVQIWYNLSK